MLGRSVGNYQLVSKLGEGGMGVVYLARHMTLGRPAAVKVLLPELSSNQEIVSRFFNEARAATAIRNAGIVEVFDFGFLDERWAYIVMEYLDGENLAARIRRGRSTVMATLTVVRAIARALQAAHELGIVHRDLKPDNVFLVPDAEIPSGERVKLLDFGIAKLVSGVSEMSHTRTGTVMGTPTYMAPEQCRGAGSVDHRADLYALGCVAYEMLCGQPPFVAEGSGEIIARHLYFQPQPLRAHRPDLRAEVEEFVLWLLQKDPQARPSTATDVLRAVDRLAAGAPTIAVSSIPMPAGVAAARPAAMDTTLSGAVSASAVAMPGLPRVGSRSTRVRLVVGAAAGAVVVLVAFLLARPAPDGAEGGSLARDAPPVSQPEATPPPSTGHEVHVALGDIAGDPRRGGASDRGAVPLSPPADPRPQPPSIQPTPPPDPRPSSEQAPVPAASDHSGGAVPGEAKPSEAAPQPVAVRTPEATKPSDDKPSPTIARSADAANSIPPPPPGTAVKSGATGKATTSTKAVDSCTRGTFATVLGAHTPGTTVVQAALARLQRCKSMMDVAVFSDIQRRLIAKL